MPFRKASKGTDTWLKMALAGPSGSGKTWTSLSIAKELIKRLAPDTRIALIDSENGSASKYADQFDFDVEDMHGEYSPAKYVEAIIEAYKAGYKVCIIDSISHEWVGQGGVLGMVDAAASSTDAGKFGAWKEASPAHNSFVSCMIATKMHVIATMRMKAQYLVDKDDRGKLKVTKVGVEPVQREGIDYEFDILSYMDMDNVLSFSGKTRCRELKGARFKEPTGVEVAEVLVDWIHGRSLAVDRRILVDFNTERVRVGDKAYQKVLTEHGLKQIEEVPTRAAAFEIYKSLQAVAGQ